MDKDAAVRAADALLWANGGRRVLLRMPAPAVAGAPGEELGLATPEFQDVELWPVVFRKAESTATMVVSASVVKGIVGSLDFDSADVLFETAAGVVVDGRVYVIEKCVALRAGDGVYGYYLSLRTPVW